ncbi:MAG: adenine phosphoribosyltransferase, partial [Acidimicrobiia bacterium]|nr:adenine phosphoribosyltransferase [Acidimicrobiia bacterium]
SIRSLIREIPDYPKPGVLFYDITPVLGDGPAFRELLELMVEPYRDAGITKVAGIEARGFTLAAPIAYILGAGFIPVRKAGKLPHDTHEETYELEYGVDSLEVHVDAASEGDRVLIVDDVIATGGTAGAVIALLNAVGAEVAGFSVFIELTFLNGRERMGAVPLHALLEF